MTTSVTNSKIQPAITMDKLHVDSLTFSQARETTPKQVIGAAGVLYGLDANNDKVFDFASFGISDVDIEATIVKAYIIAGGTVDAFNTEYANAKTSINDKISAGTMSDAVLMAHFEAAMARIFELHGKITISGVV